MALITLRDVSMHFGEEPLLDGVSLTVEPGERICLLGRNGAGKSTLMEIIAGSRSPDNGKVMRAQGVTVSGLAQGVPQDLHGTVLDVISQQMALQQPTVSEDGWRIQQQVGRIANEMNLAIDGQVSTFSAGMKRQVLLAAALVAGPDILLLDEPTNHLDMTAIDWLEAFLLKWRGTLILITHDRMLIRRLATRILEIDRGILRSWHCDYDTYLQRSQEQRDAEEKDDRRFDKKLFAEEAWIRRGIKARRTRNEGRVRALEQLRQIRRDRRDRTGRVRMTLDEAERSGKTVVEATHLTFAYGDRTIVEDFSCTILRKDRIGILGPNGAGKSTLIRLLLGELSPQQGRIKLGTNLEVLYFDQLRRQLNENKSVHENVSPDGDMLDIGGKRRHVIGYLKDFLFSPQRSRTPVWVLSGGEKNRLLLAKLFARPANVLVLDEPTNDLDVETLELLEELLLNYGGTVLLVSHDRTFVNNVVTSTLVFESPGRIESYAGGYDDWLIQRPPNGDPGAENSVPRKDKHTAPTAKTNRKKLSYMEKRELDALPDRIESLETRQQQLYQVMSNADFYRQDGETIAAVKNELAQVEKDLEDAFARWEALDRR